MESHVCGQNSIEEAKFHQILRESGYLDRMEDLRHENTILRSDNSRLREKLVQAVKDLTKSTERIIHLENVLVNHPISDPGTEATFQNPPRNRRYMPVSHGSVSTLRKNHDMIIVEQNLRETRIATEKYDYIDRESGPENPRATNEHDYSGATNASVKKWMLNHSDPGHSDEWSPKADVLLSPNSIMNGLMSFEQ